MRKTLIGGLLTVHPVVQVSELSKVGVAKGVANYLFITVPLSVQREDNSRRNEKRTIDDHCFFQWLGLTTQSERDAYRIVIESHAELRTLLVFGIDTKGTYKEGNFRHHYLTNAISFPRSEVTPLLNGVLEKGIGRLESLYCSRLPIGQKSAIVHPDFKETATQWLEERITAYLNREGECLFLDNFLLSSKNRGRVRLDLIND